ncbi:MAG: methyltransferase type 11 [Thermoleophilia bacterium]|nr:methyltransferase type 11 [Thermoleophilia bacterium]
MTRQERKPHHVRAVAESFGADAARYDRVRPSYPLEMRDAVIGAAPGREVLDVGCGTGIAARLFQQAHCSVLGVEPDPRMADFARSRGLEVEVARFEEWSSAGRTFDAVISGTTWHWLDARVGADRAAEALRPGGVLAAFWNVPHLPAPLEAAFREIYGRIAPGSPFAKPGGASHTRILDRATRGIRDSGAFEATRIRRFPWELSYTREQWLEVVPTFGGHGLLTTERLDDLRGGLSDAIDAEGGTFTVAYETLLLTATRS